jgi:signal transduction histidine kinase
MSRFISVLSVTLFLLLNTITAQDISNVDELNAKARELLQNSSSLNIEDARSTATEALTKAVQLGYTKGEAEAYLIMAETYELEGNPALGLRFRKKAQKKLANPDAQTTVIIQQPQQKKLGDFPIPVETRPRERTLEQDYVEQRPVEVRKPTPQPTVAPSFKSSGNVDSDIKNRMSELEQKQKMIEELQRQRSEQAEAMGEQSEQAARIEAQLAQQQAEYEATKSQIAALEQEKENNDLRIKQQRIVGIILINAVLVALIFIFVVIRQIRAKNKANQELAKTLDELKSTQEQLVQKEKLASLGQLTAGIAHEIQNPLNFVNNFADLSIELLEEVKESDDIEEIKEIAGDLIQNLTKIHHHGKRADSIVKNMLQHSREQKSEKEATDLNELLKEFVNLAYHGLRATDKNFNCKIEQELDKSLPKLNLVKQDLGRVLLNMFNNSFYSISKKIVSSKDDYQPVLSINTETKDNKAVIVIRDNGLGMSEDVKQKLFNPFFTTKPTGEGTGLGLSISHDIIVKLHGGSIEVDSKEGEYAEFKISLPIA